MPCSGWFAQRWAMGDQTARDWQGAPEKKRAKARHPAWPQHSQVALQPSPPGARSFFWGCRGLSCAWHWVAPTPPPHAPRKTARRRRDLLKSPWLGGEEGVGDVLWRSDQARGELGICCGPPPKPEGKAPDLEAPCLLSKPWLGLTKMSDRRPDIQTLQEHLWSSGYDVSPTR